MDNGRHYLVRSGLRAIQQHLPADEFLRVHRSYIVSFKKVSDVRNKTVYLDDLAIPISALYLDDVLRHFS